VYEELLAHPMRMWSWACSTWDSPMLWSEGCKCCDPLEVKDPACYRQRETALNHTQYYSCCHPVYARISAGPLNEDLESSLRANIAKINVSRELIVGDGPHLRWPLGSNQVASGCVISIRDRNIQACNEAHACNGFDCSYLQAFMMTVKIIRATHPLPDLDLVLNAGDVTMVSHSAIPVFTRTATLWTNTVALPFEWQLHPGQCQMTLRQATHAGEEVTWESRKSTLVWRGSPSNCLVPGCRIAVAADDARAFEACGHLPAGTMRNCKWSFSTWLQMQRGRLVWLSRFSSSIDAKFVLNNHLDMEPDLQHFLEGEGLIESEAMPVDQQQKYRYAIAVEGDSAADRLYWQLFTGAVVLVPDGPWQVLAIRDLLQPYVHYIPLKYDLSDLLEKVQWLQDHDDEAQRIARNSREFALQYLSCDHIIYYVDRLLRAYAERLN